MPPLQTFFVLAAWMILPVVQGTSTEPPRPNIVLILTDDMGFSDLGCYGGEIETLNLDALAAGGVRFTQFYNTARCCPTRASLLTGLYPHQAGVGHMVDDPTRGRAGAGYAGNLNDRCVTIAEALRPVGYRSYMTGKWHVTPYRDNASRHKTNNWPLQRGFDRFYGTIKGGGSFFDPTALTRDNTVISAFDDAEYAPKDGFYYTDAISDHAVRFIDDHARDHGDQPFFLYVAYTAAHWPMHARDEDIAKYKGRYDAGYEAIRAARFDKARNLGVIDTSWQLSPATESWKNVENAEFELRCMEVYAAMIDRMDQGVGKIVGELKEQDLFENTLILYLQDNGGCAELIGRKPQDKALPRADGPTLPPLAPDYLQPDLVPKQTRDGYPVRQGVGVMPGGADTYLGYGPGWANVSNAPFREFKHWVHEGGISTPLIAHWPAGIKPRGSLVKEQGHIIDIMPTCLHIAGAEYPMARHGEKTTPLEGVSLRCAFAGQAIDRQQPILFEHEGNRAVRDGRWKLVAKGPAGKWELYDMQVDRTELNDVAAEQPERVAAMTRQWEAWAEHADVIPWPWKPPYATARAGKNQPGQ
jgi:arylsulfatase